MSCLDDASLQDFLEGVLRPDDAVRFEAHVDQCAACFALVADLMTAAASQVSTNEQEEPVKVTDHGELTGFSVGRRYVVEELIGQGGMGRVHRAFDRLTRKSVALKRVVFGAEHKGEERRRAALTAEFRILATLRHPNIISVFDYGFDTERRPYFTMELLTGAAPLLPLAWEFSRDVRIGLLVELVRALEYLHRRGVVHGDLKPSNILVLRAIPSVRLVDFGLSRTNEFGHQSHAAGTLRYMAPELFLGHAPSAASDLFAVAILVCEILEGFHPFRRSLETASRRPTSDSYGEPDLTPLPAALSHVVARTLAMDPSKRLADCQVFLRELVVALGMTLPKETSIAGESFLIAARFTGREAERALIGGALDLAASGGKGAAFLVGGESGVGKSRLFEELRSHALVAGMFVVHGQARETAGSPYHIWQGILALVALHVDLSDIEASVLAAVIPDLSILIAREVTPQLEIGRFQLLRIMTDVILRFNGPLCLVLEDLQSADAESLALLAQVTNESRDKPIVILANYRDEEAKDLSLMLPAMRVIKLARFDRMGVTALCASMLGTPGQDAKLVDLVMRETEGNTYFVVEALRALAEESGGRVDVGRRVLPERLLSGGIEQVLLRRLTRVPNEATRFLRLAAASGREIDVTLLATMEPDVDAKIRACADVGILEVHEERWRFSHDKLIQQTLQGVDATTYTALHAEIADGIEVTYPAASSHAVRLACHLRESGRHSRAAHAFIRAGDLALASGAPGEALVHFEQARIINDTIDASQLERAQVWRGITQANFGLGKLIETDRALRHLSEVVGSPLPDGRLAFGKALGEVVARRIAHSSRIPPLVRWAGFEPDEQRLMEELLLGLSAQETYVWLMRPDLLLVCTMRGHSLEEIIGRRDRTHFRAAIAFILAHTPLRRFATHYLANAARSIEKGSIAEVHHQRLVAILALEEGRFIEAATIAADAAESARIHKDDLVLADCLLQQELGHSGAEDYRAAFEVCIELEQVAGRMQNPRYLVLALLGQAHCHLFFGNTARLETLLVRCRAENSHNLGPLIESFVLAMSALSAILRADRGYAETQALRATSSVERIPGTMAALRHPLACILDVLLHDAASVERNESTIRSMLMRLQSVGRVYSFAAPLAIFFEGRFALARGQVARAARQLRNVATMTGRIGSRFDQARGRYWLARVAEHPQGPRHVPEGAPFHDEIALELFENLGCQFESNRVRETLERRAKPAESLQT